MIILAVVLSVLLVFFIAATIFLYTKLKENINAIDDLVIDIETSYVEPLREMSDHMSELSKLTIFSDDEHVKTFVSLSKDIVSTTTRMCEDFEKIAEDTE